MKKLPSIKASMAIITILIVNILSIKTINGSNTLINSETIMMNNYVVINSVNTKKIGNEKIAADELLAIYEEAAPENEEVPEIVYDGMTLEELAEKLNKNLKSTLKGYGNVFAKYAIKYEVDPYLALAIVLHETGCNSGKCSTLTSKCNNVGGMKGSNTCGNGSYAKFKTLDAGIEAFFKNLSKNYYKKGLNTPEKMGKKYAESTTWATQVRSYMKKIQKS